MPLMAGGFKLTWKLPVEGNRGAAAVSVGLPPLEGGTTMSTNFPATEPHKIAKEVNLDVHAVEDCGRQ